MDVNILVHNLAIFTVFCCQTSVLKQNSLGAHLMSL